jgi:hypothetical protein
MQYRLLAGTFPAISAMNPQGRPQVLTEQRGIRRQIRNITKNPPVASVPAAQSICRVILVTFVCENQAEKWIP